MIIPKLIHRHLFCYNISTILSARTYSIKNPNPIAKTWNIISKDIPVLFGLNKKPKLYPEHADIVIIGGGFIGSAIAYWLKKRASQGLSIVVLEKDQTFQETQTKTSSGTLIQHFSLPENVYLAQYGADFLRNIKENLNSDVDIEYYPTGHLVLASEKYAERLEENVSIQKEFGIKNELLTVKNINERYPWINTNDIQLGCIGTECEGYFNSWTLLKALINKSQELGTTYVNAEVTGFELEQQRDVLMEGVAPGSFQKINRVLYTTPDNEEHAIKFAACILAAGEQSKDIAKFAKIGTGEGLLNIPLPIEQREEKVYLINKSNQKMGLNTPMIMDTSGLWLRNNSLGNNFMCGHVPLSTVNAKDCTEDEYYQTLIKPSLINRFPDCQGAKVESQISEKYDWNTYDETGILGPHPYHNNLYLATGFGRQGCQFAPGIGRAIAELIIDSHFINIDLTRFTFDRILTDQPLIEFNIY